MEEVKKHPDFPQWIKSKDGLDCLNMATLTDKKFLENRLFWAFDAGRNCVWHQYLSMKEENKRLREALETQLQTIKALIKGKRIVNLDEAIAYYENLLSPKDSLPSS